MGLFRHLFKQLPGVLLFILYVAAAKLGLALAFQHTSVSPVWPPTGIALCGLLLLGIPYWPVVWLGAFVANEWFTPTGLWISSGIATGNMLEAVVGTALLARLCPARKYFDRPENVGFFILVCGVATMVSASVGTLSLYLGKTMAWADLPTLWFTWWVGDAGGALVLVPWVFSLREALRRHWSWPEIAEGITLLAVSVWLCGVTFGAPASLDLAFLHIPVFVWASVRFLQWGGASLVAVVSTLAIHGTLTGIGQYPIAEENKALLMLQIFIIVSAATSQFLAALISERKQHIEKLTRSEQDLRDSDERFRQLAGNIREVFYILEAASGRILYLSPAFEQIWRVSREQVSQNPERVLESIHPEDKEFWLASREKQSRGEPSSTEYRILLPNGGVSWIWDRTFPVRDEEGNAFRVAGIAEDVTLRKEVDAELRLKAEELARANRELEHFASVASHDLKAPLRTVSSFVRLLKKSYEDQLDSQANEYIEFAVDGCRRMDELIEALLRNARIGGKVMEWRSISLENAVRSALHDLEAQIAESGASITFDDLPEVLGDDTQFREVFQNLFSNALKYRSQEPPRIVVSAHRRENEWILSVEDNGIGIAPESRQNIFCNFVRLRTQEGVEGSGIGLATCKKVIEERGGRIWVEPAKKKGSVFSFTVPDVFGRNGLRKVKGGEGEWALRETSQTNDKVVESGQGICEILIVEDNPADSNVIEILLKREQFPFRIHEVPDGEQALCFLRRVGKYNSAPIPSLVFLDLNLPKMDGLTVLKEIKADPNLRNIPVIVLSGSAREEDIRAVYDQAASCYMHKPRDLNGYRDMLSYVHKFWIERAPLSGELIEAGRGRHGPA